MTELPPDTKWYIPVTAIVRLLQWIKAQLTTRRQGEKMKINKKGFLIIEMILVIAFMGLIAYGFNAAVAYNDQAGGQSGEQEVIATEKDCPPDQESQHKQGTQGAVNHQRKGELTCPNGY